MSKLPVKIYKVEDKSMEPSLKQGDYILVNMWYRELNYRDVVVLEHPRKKISIVKRVTRVDRDQIFVSGDNLEHSEDSRHFGDVDIHRIIGKVIYKI